MPELSGYLDTDYSSSQAPSKRGVKGNKTEMSNRGPDSLVAPPLESLLNKATIGNNHITPIKQSRPSAGAFGTSSHDRGVGDSHGGKDAAKEARERVVLQKEKEKKEAEEAVRSREAEKAARF